ncbi:glycoside hydrolase [Glycomyces sp. NPDC047010]|uniref:GH39 family glycosyl hydrolase n=1 Tax=Glycomyces sp. NPDC047010 TaxID=3155023 RepID=UPI0033EB2BDB
MADTVRSSEHAGHNRAHPRAALSDPHPRHVREAEVRIDAASPTGDLAPIWASMGYDEINYTYRPDGKKLLGSIGEFSPRAYHVRPHYMFCSGSGWGQPHWGNGNVYHEDADGNPFYDFTLLDETYDAITGAGHHVLVELGFTPKDLVPEKAHDVFPVISSPTVYSAYEHGLWSFPPKDYGKWAGLCAATAAHVLERYGAEEVSTWVWELWNEPDIFYWRGTPQQYYDLYTVTAEAIRGVLPDARVGGPSVTGGDAGVEFLRGFLEHCKRTGTPLDYVSFHTKGSAFTPWRTYGPIGAPAPVQESPSAMKMLFEVDRLLAVMDEFPEYAALPALIDECDAGVPAHHSAYDNPNFRFQNTEYYPVFQAKLMKKLLDLAAAHNDNIEQATTWSFYFEGERYFEGTRSWTTQGGIEKPFMNAYRLFAKLGDRRLPAVSDKAFPIDDLSGREYGMPEEVDALASIADDGTVTALVWRHGDDQYAQDAERTAAVLAFSGLDAGSYTATEYRIDADHSNAHTVWEALGSPQEPDADALKAIHARQGLETVGDARTVQAEGGALRYETALPLPSVSLVVLEPR